MSIITCFKNSELVQINHRENNLPKESGAILLFVALLIPAILAMLALAVDIGLFFLYRGNLQQVADASSLVAVEELSNFRFQQNFRDVANDCEMLADPAEVDLYDSKGFLTDELGEEGEECTPAEDPTEDRRARRFSTPITNRAPLFTSFKNIKPTVLAVLSRQNIKGINAAGRQALGTSTTSTSEARIRFNAPTFNGESCLTGSNTNLDYDQHTSSCTSAGNLEIRLTRGVRCYSNPAERRRLDGTADSPWARDRYFCPLENSAPVLTPDFLNSWDWVNSVMIELKLSNAASFFSQAAFGLTTTDLSLRSVGFLPTPQSAVNTPLCALPLCSEVFRAPGDSSEKPAFIPSDFGCQVIGQWVI